MLEDEDEVLQEQTKSEMYHILLSTFSDRGFVATPAQIPPSII